MPFRDRRKLIALVLVLALAVIALVSVGSWQRAPERQSPVKQKQDDGPAASETDTAVRDEPDAEPPIDDTRDEAGVQEDAPPEATGEKSPTDSTPVQPAEEKPVKVSLTVVDGTGTPLPLARFEYALLSAYEYMMLRQEDPAASPAQADAGGKWTATGEGNGVLFLRADNGFSCVSADTPWRRRLSGDPDVTAFRLSNQPEQEFILEVEQRETFRLYIEYEDAEAFEGKVNIGEFTTPEREQLIRDFELHTYRPGMEVAYHRTTGLRLFVSAPRDGFRRSNLFEPGYEELTAGTLTLVVPRDDDRPASGGFILDHRHFAPEQKMFAVLTSWGGSFNGTTLELSGPGETRSDSFATPGRRGCIAFGDGEVWTSRVILFEEGEWKRVVVNPEPPAQLSLVVRDDRGNPLKGAVVSAEDVGHVDWEWPNVQGPDSSALKMPENRSEMTEYNRRLNRARSDADGRVDFHVAWPGKRRYIVQAVGYETRFVDADLTAGRLTDLGTVSLSRATGTVTIRIKVASDDDPTKYTGKLFIPFGGTAHRESVPFNAEGVARIENVASGEYQVIAAPLEPGSPNTFKLIELNTGESKEVVIDMTRPPGLQED